jgi:adenylate cyclase, class 2
MQAPEIELKFPVDDPTILQALLPQLGFRLDTPRSFEQNTLYDSPDRHLQEQRQLLRLRQYAGAWTVTHKRPPSAQEIQEASGNPDRYKVRIETETEVEDGAAMAEIFTRLGYGPVFRYEKFRTEWSHPVQVNEGTGLVTGHLVVDETPIGNYAELEGPVDWIDAMLAQLGIDHGRCLTESYGRLFLAWKERTGSPAENLTFAEIGAVLA